MGPVHGAKSHLSGMRLGAEMFEECLRSVSKRERERGGGSGGRRGAPEEHWHSLKNLAAVKRRTRKGAESEVTLLADEEEEKEVGLLPSSF